MATITICINEETNKRFREIIKRNMGEGKGILGKAVEEAINRWIEDEEQKQIAERQMQLAKKGLYSLKGWKFNREEANER